MKKIILFVLILISFSANAQDYDQLWTKVIEFENNEKIKSAQTQIKTIQPKLDEYDGILDRIKSE